MSTVNGLPGRLEGAFAGGDARGLQALREVASELQKQARSLPGEAARGVVEALVSLGSLPEPDGDGNLRASVRREVEGLVSMLVRLGARSDELEALWRVYRADEAGALEPLADAWGELCARAGVADAWADRLASEVLAIWSEGGDARASRACLAVLLGAGRAREVLELLALRPVGIWPERRFGVRALAALGDVDGAIAYAQESNLLGHAYAQEIAQVCEGVLLTAGRREEAFRDYAFLANTRQNCLQTFRALAERYPERARDQLLAELIARSPGQEGRWFATARSLRFYELALEIAQRSACDPRTLNRAAAERLSGDPHFAVEVALASLRWIADDQGHAIDGQDVYDAFDLAMQGAALLGAESAVQARVRAICEQSRPSAEWVRHLLASEIAAGPGSR